MNRLPRLLQSRWLFLAGAGILVLLCVAETVPSRRGHPPAVPLPVAAPAPERTLTVAFWNLDWFPGQRPHAKAAAQAAHIEAVVPVAGRIDPDVFGLEELADRRAAETVVGRLPGFKVDICSEFLRGPESKRRRTTKAGDDDPAPNDSASADDDVPWTFPDHQQVALCSRLPVLAVGAEAWKPDASGRRQRRGFVFAVYRTAPGEALLVYGLHLKSNVLDEPGGQSTNVLLREEAGRQFLAHERATAAAWAHTDRLRLVIVGGDMNTSLDDAQFREETTLRAWQGADGFRWGWEGLPLLRRLTLPAKGRYPATCFDHVFYRAGDPAVKLTSAAVESTGPQASDHRPVVARFGW